MLAGDARRSFLNEIQFCFSVSERGSPAIV